MLFSTFNQVNVLVQFLLWLSFVLFLCFYYFFISWGKFSLLLYLSCFSVHLFRCREMPTEALWCKNTYLLVFGCNKVIEPKLWRKAIVRSGYSRLKGHVYVTVNPKQWPSLLDGMKTHLKCLQLNLCVKQWFEQTSSYVTVEHECVFLTEESLQSLWAASISQLCVGNETLVDVDRCGGWVQVWTYQQFLFLAVRVK